MNLRILLGDARCAARNLDAIVVCPVERRVRNLVPYHISRSRHRLLSVLLIRFGRLVSYEELSDWMWAHDLDGGPLAMQNTIGVQTSGLRHALHGTPVGITTRWGLGLLAEPASCARRATNARYYPRRHSQETSP